MTTLEESYARCRQLNRRHGTTYYASTFLLPSVKRPHVHALYGFCRYADEIVDSMEAVDVEVRAKALADLGDRFLADLAAGRSDDPVLKAVVHTARAFDLPASAFERFLASMAMDLSVATYETFDDLLVYMDGSAAVIGELMLPILEPVSEEAFEPARALGVAFQLTNFIRDVDEDLDRGRVYLPQADLRRFDADPWRRVADEPWRALLRFVLREILRGDEPAVLLHVTRKGFGNPPRVERVGSVVGNRLERLAEIGEDDPVSLLPVAPAGLAVGRDRRRVLAHRAAQLRVEVARQIRVQHEAVARERHRGLDQPLPRQRAQLGVRERKAAHAARHTRREVAVRRQRAVDVAVGAEIHRRRRRAGSLLAEVERARRAVGHPHDDEAAAADVAGRGMRDRERERRCDGRVDRVASVGQYGRADIRCERRRRDDEAGARRNTRGLGLCGKEEGSGQQEPEHDRIVSFCNLLSRQLVYSVSMASVLRLISFALVALSLLVAGIAAPGATWLELQFLGLVLGVTLATRSMGARYAVSALALGLGVTTTLIVGAGHAATALGIDTTEASATGASVR